MNFQLVLWQIEDYTHLASMSSKMQFPLESSMGEYGIQIPPTLVSLQQQIAHTQSNQQKQQIILMQLTDHQFKNIFFKECIEELKFFILGNNSLNGKRLLQNKIWFKLSCDHTSQESAFILLGTQQSIFGDLFNIKMSAIVHNFLSREVWKIFSGIFNQKCILAIPQW